jgi:uncharacterized delta-60 repeat protein
MRRTFLILLSLVALAWAGAASASAAARPDPGYGKQGVAILPGTKGAPVRRAVAIEPSGALILLAGGSLERLGPAGRLDRGFGQGGKVTPAPLPGGELSIDGAAVDGQGRIVVVATSKPPQTAGREVPLHLDTTPQLTEPKHSDARIIRYLPNGTLDPSFGQGGVVETDFGLPTPEVEGVKLAAAPVVEPSGVAIDGAGRIVVSGEAVAGVTTFGCAHDDYGGRATYAAFVARLTEAGAADPSFGAGGIVGGRSAGENVLGAEGFANPSITPEGGVVAMGAGGKCGLVPSRFLTLTSAGAPGAVRELEGLAGTVTDATAAPDGSVFLLLGAAGSTTQAIEKLRPDGGLDPTFGAGGIVTLRLGAGYPHHLRVAADGEVLIEATRTPSRKRGEKETLWRSRSKMVLVGLTPAGARDPRIGPHGTVSRRVALAQGTGALWLDPERRATVTVGYRPGPGPAVGLAAIRFLTGA